MMIDRLDVFMMTIPTYVAVMWAFFRIMELEERLKAMGDAAKKPTVKGD